AAMGRLLTLNPTLAEIDHLTDIEDKVLAAINNANDIILREYHYDAATGRLAWIQDNTTGKRVDYTYDARGNQTGRKRTGEATNLSDSSFVFDARGRMVWSVQRPGNVVTFRYDAHDRI